MTIFLTGDLHGQIDIQKLSSDNFSEGKTLTKNDFLIVLGDFGLIFHEPSHKNYRSEKHWLNWLEKKPWTTLFVDGNHENFDIIEKLPEVEMFGSKVGKVNNSIYHLKRGNIYTIENKTFLALGGAASVDKNSRLFDEKIYKQKLWWDQELWTKKEENYCLDILDKNNWKVDYVISHTAPDKIIEDMFRDHWSFSQRFNDPTARFFDYLYSKANLIFKKWYFGHFHKNRELKKFRCLYGDIVRLN